METNKHQEPDTQTDSIEKQNYEWDQNSYHNSNIFECNTQAEDLVKDDQNESLLSKNEAQIQIFIDKSKWTNENDWKYENTSNSLWISKNDNKEDTISCIDGVSDLSKNQNIVNLNTVNLHISSSSPELWDLDSNKMKWVLRDFKKFYHKQVKLVNLGKSDYVNILENYIKSCDLDHQAAEEDSNNTFYSSWFKISFYLSLVVHPLMWFSNSKFAKFLEDQNCLTSESSALLVINDIIFKLTTERLIRFWQPKENKLLINYFLDQMSDECKTKYQEEVKILKSLSMLENQHSHSSE